MTAIGIRRMNRRRRVPRKRLATACETASTRLRLVASAKNPNRGIQRMAGQNVMRVPDNMALHELPFRKFKC